MVVRACRVALVLLLLVVPLMADTQPPRDLKLVGDHWTPYDPPDPSTFPADARVHIIVPGDTLWDLAATFYGDPYLWPQLWEQNTYIRDSHWIYPGDPLLVEMEVMPTDQIESPGEMEGEGEGEDMVIGGRDRDWSAPVPLGTLSDVYCFGYLGDPDEALPNVIASFEDTEVKYIPGALEQSMSVSVDDVVYIMGGTSTGILPGETYLIVEPGELVPHPKTLETIGRQYYYRGQLRVLCADEDTSTAIIVQACSGINIGSRLKPVPQIPIPVARLEPMERHCDEPRGMSDGYIVNAKDFRYSLGEGSVVQINLGWEDFIQPGDFLTVYRDSIVEGQPPLILGEIGILTAEPHSATAKVVQMRYSMEVGDRIEIK